MVVEKTEASAAGTGRPATGIRIPLMTAELDQLGVQPGRWVSQVRTPCSVLKSSRLRAETLG
jgi:hypothetical protein